MFKIFGSILWKKYPEINIQSFAINRLVDVISEGLDSALRVRVWLLDDPSLTMKIVGYP